MTKKIVILTILSLALLAGCASETTPIQPDPRQANQSGGDSPEPAIFSDNPEMLRNCEPSKETFTHPLTGSNLTRSIEGMSNNTCLYKEELPRDMEMTCRYPENTWDEVVQYYINLGEATNTSTQVTMNSAGETNTSYMIDGESVSNPLQHSLNTGICQIQPSDV